MRFGSSQKDSTKNTWQKEKTKSLKYYNIDIIDSSSMVKSMSNENQNILINKLITESQDPWKDQSDNQMTNQLIFASVH